MTSNAASTLVELAERLATTLPDTRQALEAGRIDLSNARVLCDLTHGLDPRLCDHLEATVLPTADQRTTGQLRRRIRGIIQRLAPQHLQKRKREAICGRRLEVWDEDYNGTCTLAVSGLDPVQAHATYNRITAAARGIKTEGDTRAVHDIHDRLTQPRDSWCGLHDPAHGRTTYRPTTLLRRTLQARHARCAFPTCNQRSTLCDLDHTIPRGRGKTCQCNLAPLCRKHHRTNQTPGWRLLQPWLGLLIWVTPSGNWHIVLPTRE